MYAESMLLVLVRANGDAMAVPLPEQGESVTQFFCHAHFVSISKTESGSKG